MKTRFVDQVGHLTNSEQPADGHQNYCHRMMEAVDTFPKMVVHPSTTFFVAVVVAVEKWNFEGQNFAKRRPLIAADPLTRKNLDQKKMSMTRTMVAEPMAPEEGHSWPLRQRRPLQQLLPHLPVSLESLATGPASILVLKLDSKWLRVPKRRCPMTLKRMKILNLILCHD